jgi:hypothetical protein
MEISSYRDHTNDFCVDRPFDHCVEIIRKFRKIEVAMCVDEGVHGWRLAVGGWRLAVGSMLGHATKAI